MIWGNILYIGDNMYTEQQINKLFDNHTDFTRLIKRIQSNTKNPQTRMDLYKMIKNYEAAWFELWKIQSAKNRNPTTKKVELVRSIDFYLEVKSNLEQWLMVARLEK